MRGKAGRASGRDDGQTPIAFLIAAHGDPAMVSRLVCRLRPHRVFIHLDAKTEMTDAWRTIDATFVEPRVPVYWAGYSQVDATLALLRTALATGERFVKLVLLSGACYPILPIARLADLFARDRELNYIRYVNMTRSSHLMSMISHRYHRDGILPSRLVARSQLAAKAEKVVRKLHALSAGKLPDRWTLPLTPYHGSSWWALTIEAARFAVAEIDRRPELVAKYKRSFASDEQVFHTIIGNSSFAASATGEIPFTGRGTWKAANLHLIDPSLTRWYDGGDIDKVIASDRYFVRKVSSDRSGALLDALDDHAERLEGEPHMVAGGAR
jgi:hypothetical protein